MDNLFGMNFGGAALVVAHSIRWYGLQLVAFANAIEHFFAPPPALEVAPEPPAGDLLMEENEMWELVEMGLWDEEDEGSVVTVGEEEENEE